MPPHSHRYRFRSGTGGRYLWSNVTFTLLFAVVTGLSVREFCQVVNRRADVQTNAVICTVAGIYLFLAVSGFCSNLTPSGVFIPYLLSVAYLLVSELYLKSEHALNNWAYTMMSQMTGPCRLHRSIYWLTNRKRLTASVWPMRACCRFPYSYSFGPVTPELTVSVRFRSSQTVSAYLSEQIVEGSVGGDW